jgi:long-chain acyl-CoA synthetase
MTSVAPPQVVFEGRLWPARELARLSAAWGDALRGIVPSRGLVALPLANHPRSVALFFALASLPAPIVLLPPHPGGWRSTPPVPDGTPLVLIPEMHALVEDADRMGLKAVVLTEPELRRADATPEILRLEVCAPGVVIFTSGSTDLPKPVYRPMAGVFQAAELLVEAFDLRAGGGVLGVVPIARGFGLIHALMLATIRHGCLALLERFDSGRVITLLAEGGYDFWPTTAVLADLLARHPGETVPPGPRICIAAGRLPRPVCERFQARFGVPLRQMYGTTETGPVTADSAPASGVRSQTAGRALRGVRIAIGEDPRAPVGSGLLGRVWVSSPVQMLGFGFPPDLEPLEAQDEWLATRDVGTLDETGTLSLAGRLDDCIRTAAGYLVNPADIASTLEEYPGVTDAVVVPLAERQGPVIGALVQAADTVVTADLRRHLAKRLPPWCHPRVLEVTRRLPRLVGGKTDRLACIEILDRICRTGDGGREAKPR